MRRGEEIPGGGKNRGGASYRPCPGREQKGKKKGLCQGGEKKEGTTYRAVFQKKREGGGGENNHRATKKKKKKRHGEKEGEVWPSYEGEGKRDDQSTRCLLFAKKGKKNKNNGEGKKRKEGAPLIVCLSWTEERKKKEEEESHAVGLYSVGKGKGESQELMEKKERHLCLGKRERGRRENALLCHGGKKRRSLKKRNGKEDLNPARAFKRRKVPHPSLR